MAEQVVSRRDNKGNWAQDLVENVKSAWPQFRQYASDVIVETKKVTRPGKQEVYGTTIMVILTTFLFGIYFWICDQIFQNAVSRILRYLVHRS